jgi:2-methylisocitrate lyase-like PEP mutase family enzyme
MLKGGMPSFGGKETDSGIAARAWIVGVHVGGSTAADIARAEKFAAAGADMFFTASLECVPLLRRITDKPLFLCVSNETGNISEAQQRAESAGVDGINVVITAPERIIDGSLAAKRK